MAGPAHRRGAATRAQVPALLKGLIFGPNGRPMSPSHTRRRGRIYRYYVTRDAIANGCDTCPVTSMPAADVEGAVLDHVQKLLAAPELVARAWATNEGVRETLLLMPAFKRIVDRIPQGLTDSGGVALVAEVRPDLPKADAAVQWRIVRDWIAEFFQDQFEVAPESFITRLRPR